MKSCLDLNLPSIDWYSTSMMLRFFWFVYSVDSISDFDVIIADSASDIMELLVLLCHTARTYVKVMSVEIRYGISTTTA